MPASQSRQTSQASPPSLPSASMPETILAWTQPSFLRVSHLQRISLEFCISLASRECGKRGGRGRLGAGAKCRLVSNKYAAKQTNNQQPEGNCAQEGRGGHKANDASGNRSPTQPSGTVSRQQSRVPRAARNQHLHQQQQLGVTRSR